MLSYNELYKTALQRLSLDENEVVRFEPTSQIFLPQLFEPIPESIIIWLKSGQMIVYIDKH